MTLITFFTAPRFLNKLAVHITKNFIDLLRVKVPLILGIHGRKGKGKTFQCELVYQKIGIDVIHISAGKLESPDASDPSRLIRLRYRYGHGPIGHLPNRQPGQLYAGVWGGCGQTTGHGDHRAAPLEGSYALIV